MTSKIKITPKAKADLRVIWNYTADNWGEQQADKYVTELHERFEWLVDNIQLGQERSEIK